MLLTCLQKPAEAAAVIQPHVSKKEEAPPRAAMSSPVVAVPALEKPALIAINPCKPAGKVSSWHAAASATSPSDSSLPLCAWLPYQAWNVCKPCLLRSLTVPLASLQKLKQPAAAAQPCGSYKDAVLGATVGAVPGPIKKAEVHVIPSCILMYMPCSAFNSLMSFSLNSAIVDLMTILSIGSCKKSDLSLWPACRSPRSLRPPSSRQSARERTPPCALPWAAHRQCMLCLHQRSPPSPSPTPARPLARYATDHHGMRHLDAASASSAL